MTYKILAALILAFIVAGCGQSGPLYIPGNPSKIQQPPSQAESTAEDEADEQAEENGEARKE